MPCSAYTMITLPKAFCARMQDMLGEEYPAFLASYERDMQRGLRVNLCKSTRDDFLNKTRLPLRPMPACEDGFYLDCAETGTGKLPAHHAGMFYLQEPAAMLPIAAAHIKEGDYVLDVCAAPGGKSTQIASRIGESGLLVSNEFVSSRAKILHSNIERLGVKNAIVTNTDAMHLAAWYERAFDVVVVDAPCSGEGMFRKNPLAIEEWSEENVAMCAKRSYEILDNAEACLRDGGLLVYSTCTFSVEENEGLIARFLSAHENYEILPLTSGVREMTAKGLAIDGCDADTTLCGRCYPHITGGEGQFVCVMKKGGDGQRNPIRDTLKQPDKAEAAALGAFFDEVFISGKAPTVKKLGSQLYAVPAHMAVNGVCFSVGVCVGEIRGGRLVPHHQLFSAYGKDMKHTWDLSSEDERVMRYLHGDTVSLAPHEMTDNGFGCVLVDGCPLGGAKCVDGVLKNHYPKGLRVQGI